MIEKSPFVETLVETRSVNRCRVNSNIIDMEVDHITSDKQWLAV